MQQKDKSRIDIVNEVLEECIMAYPLSSFIISLYKQYQLRGSLSKKQIQGLHAKASKIENIHPGKLAGLEVILKKMPTRYKSEIPAAKPEFERDEVAGKMIDEILHKFPNHKRVLFLKTQYESNVVFSPADLADLKRFHQIATK